LQTGGEIWRLANRCLLPRLARSDRFADNHETRRDADADPHAFAQCWRLADLSDDRKRRTDRPLSIVLMRPRVTKIDQHAIADIAGDKAVEACDCRSNAGLIAADDRTKILWVKSRRHLGGICHVAEHHAHLAAFGDRLLRPIRFIVGGTSGLRRRARIIRERAVDAQLRNCIQ
jgi:hypothetical protein